MKRLIVLICIVFTVVSMTARVVVMPQFKKSSFGHLILRSIELSDTATVVNFSFLHLHNWWCSSDSMSIAGNITGKTYRLKRADGYTLGEKKFMPESGRYDFKLVFEPVAEVDTMVDLIEANSGKKMIGVDLTGKVPDGKILTRISGTYPRSEGFVALAESSSKAHSNTHLWIPVDNGEFHYDFYTDSIPVVYEIHDGLSRFNGVIVYGKFFTGDSGVTLKGVLDEDGSFGKFEVSAPDGTMTKSYMDLRSELSVLWNSFPAKLRRDSLMAAKKYYVPELYALRERLKQCPEERDSIELQVRRIYESGKIKTPEGEAVENAIGEFVENDMLRVELQKAMALDNIAGLYSIVNRCWFSRDASPFVDAWRKAYSDKFPGHPYAEYMKSLDKTIDPVPGNRFNDFSAPDLNGVVHTLSDEIKGRVAVIDLWASWCGPCRRTSKELVPIYDEFATKGFTIVGIAREYGGPEKAAQAIKDEGMKWLNLVEVDDLNGIWAIYRRWNSAGGIFLVDENGVIVSVDPSPEDVRAYLENRFK